MSHTFGLHFGNTSACLAAYKDGKVDVVSNNLGDRITPAVVAYLENERVVGNAAKVNSARQNNSVVIHNKILMDDTISSSDIEDFCHKANLKIVQNESGVKHELKKENETTLVSPAEVATCILKSLFGFACNWVHADSDLRVVLCVPHHFSKASRQALSNCAEAAGFEVLQVISEPAAALQAHDVGLKFPEKSLYCLVCRVGGLTMGVTIFFVSGGTYSMCKNVKRINLGGHQFTKLLADYLAVQHHRRLRSDPRESRRSMSKLLAAAETCKHVLSTMGTSHCFVESLYEGFDLVENVTRARFENIISSVISDYLEPVHEALREANLKAEDINEVIVCGGSMKIPKLQNEIRKIFKNAEILNNNLSPDEVIAIGAAKQASYLPKKFDPHSEHFSVELPVSAEEIFIKIMEINACDCIISRKTPLPVERKKKYQIPSGSRVTLEVFEGNSKSEDSATLAKMELDEVVTPGDILLKLNIDINGNIEVSVTDLKTKKTKTFKSELAET